MVSRQIIEYAERHLADKISVATPVSGGSINRTYKLQGSKTAYFIKVNSKSWLPGMFKAEAAGLDLIRKTGSVNVPNVLCFGDTGDESFLIMEWITARRATTRALEELGRCLAQMHRNTSNYFGLDYDNYMGSLQQSNKKYDNWADFFIGERLQPMVKIAVDKKLLTTNGIADFNRLYNNLPGLFNPEPPSLIHGDLWGGNYLVDDSEVPYLIDPAVSYGQREFDIAMTTLFGGFSDTFYYAYQEAYPLTHGWEHRLNLWNLYPLLVHLNLFGKGYLGQVRECLKGYL